MRLVLHLLLLLSALTACTGQDQALFENGDFCRSTLECGTNQICESNRCRQMPDPIDELDVQITPAANSPYVKTQQLKLPVTSDSALLIELPVPTEHRVVIFDDAFSPPEELDARISFAGAPRIIGKRVDLSTELRASSLPSQIVRLVPGDYDVTLTRLDSAPSLRTRFTVRPSNGERTTKEFHIAYDRRIYGDVSSSVSESTKLGGVRVTAYSTTSGLASTSTVTGPRGHYEIMLPDTDDTAFRLVAAPIDGQQPAWGFEEIVMVPLGEDRQKNIALEPTSTLIQGTARLRFGSGTREGFLPLIGATVILTASTSENLTTRAYRVSGSTDAEGWLRAHSSSAVRDLSLLKGLYIAEISPPPGSQIMTSFEEIDLSSVGAGVAYEQQVQLDLRSHVRGEVRSDLGRPVAFADVELRSIDLDTLPFTTRTGANGELDLWLDPGRYVMSIVPSGATDVDELVPVSARIVDIFGAPEEDLGVITMPGASVAVGVLTGAIDGDRVRNAKVELFQEIMGRAVRIAETFSDGDGRFEAVLPR